jgi:hypothetical protein
MHMCSTIGSENVLYAEGEDEGERLRPARKILARGNCTCPRSPIRSADRRSASSRRSTRIQVCRVKRRRLARSRSVFATIPVYVGTGPRSVSTFKLQLPWAWRWRSREPGRD